MTEATTCLPAPRLYLGGKTQVRVLAAFTERRAVFGIALQRVGGNQSPSDRTKYLA